MYGEGPGGGGSKRRRNATGGVPLGSAALAVAAAAQLGTPQLLRCELCNATFGNDAQMQQHLDGPAHRKALERQAAERQRRERLGRHCDAAEAAVVSFTRWGGREGQGTMLYLHAGSAGLVSGAGATGRGDAWWAFDALGRAHRPATRATMCMSTCIRQLCAGDETSTQRINHRTSRWRRL